jgi:Tol biopolymer transport system component
MRTYDDIDRRIATWLDAAAPSREPDLLLERVLATTATMPRRPAWRVRERWLPMSASTTHMTQVGRLPWRSLLLAALLLLTLAIGATLLAGSRRLAVPAPFGPAGNGVLLGVRDGNIVARDTPAGPARILIDTDQPLAGPVPSRDGMTVSYFGTKDWGTDAARITDVWVADIDGGNARLISGPLSSPAGWVEWSPTGDAVAVNEFPDGGDPRVVFLAADGRGATPFDVGIPVVRPQFRPPDGRQILFQSDDRTAVYVANADGTGLRELALPAGIDDASDLSWNAAGTHVTYFAPPPDSASDEGRGLEVHVAALADDGTVSDDRVIAHPATASDSYPEFLPDGERVLFWRSDGGRLSMHLASVDDLSAESVDLGCCNERGGRVWAIGKIVSPDGSTLLAWDDRSRSSWSIDLATAQVTRLEPQIEDIVAWQRTSK